MAGSREQGAGRRWEPGRAGQAEQEGAGVVGGGGGARWWGRPEAALGGTSTGASTRTEDWKIKNGEREKRKALRKKRKPDVVRLLRPNARNERREREE